MSSPDLFVTGTDTSVGKTLLSALLVAALSRNYWKPIQTGASQGADRDDVIRWTGIPPTRIHPEAYVFDPPVSPHLAARWQGATIHLKNIMRPEADARLIIEGAGGAMVPLNESEFMIDLMRHLGAPVVIASRTVLGTINHTLLTVQALEKAGLEVQGVVMIGEENTDNSRAIEHYGKVPVIGSIPWLDQIDRATLCSVFAQHFDNQAFK
jgi:dethiobiotin synthetase